MERVERDSSGTEPNIKCMMDHDTQTPFEEESSEAMKGNNHHHGWMIKKLCAREGVGVLKEDIWGQ